MGGGSLALEVQQGTGEIGVSLQGPCWGHIDLLSRYQDEVKEIACCDN